MMVKITITKLVVIDDVNQNNNNDKQWYNIDNDDIGKYKNDIDLDKIWKSIPILIMVKKKQKNTKQTSAKCSPASTHIPVGGLYN